MPNMNDYHAYKSTSNGSGGSSGGNGSGKVVIIIVAILLIYFIFSGASWDAIETLLSFGLIAYFLGNFLFS